MRAARNLMTDEWRRDRRRPLTDLAPHARDAVTDPAPRADQRLEDRERLSCVARALAQMPPRTRRVFELHRLGGRTIAEVGAGIGLSPTRTWGLIHEAYRIIRQHLNGG